MKPNTHTVLYDPHGMFGARLPLDRAPYERLVAAVLSWTDPAALTPHDFEQIALQLTGYARAVATDVRHHADLLDEDTGPRALAEIILAETQRRLDTAHQGTLRSVQNRARLVRALYERLDRLQAAPDLNHQQSPQPTAQDPGRWCGVSLCSADMSRGRSSAVDGESENAPWSHLGSEPSMAPIPRRAGDSLVRVPPRP